MDLSILNNRQKQAVETVVGPLLVLAGAGSGKTRVLTYRIAHLIEDHGVLPGNILALTFTNKAAQEMRHRVERLIGSVTNNMWIGTFHSICVRILRRDARALGYSDDFTIYDTTDQKTLIKDVMKQLNISDKDIKVAFVRARISEAKNEWIGPERFQDLYSKDYQLKQVGKIYAAYQDRLHKNNAMDFDDLLLNALKLLKAEPELMDFYQRKFMFIHVDEYQDTNAVQYQLIRLLANHHKNLCVVGDNDQSIYGWRGADIRNIQDFEKDFQGAQVVLLEQNYRSTQTILQVANKVIENNSQRKDKRLWTDNHAGDRVHYFNARDEFDEARYVASNILKALDEGDRYSDSAVLYRTNAQSRQFEEAFIRAGIPYKIIGGLKFYERMEIKDLMAYLKVVANPSDDVSLLRVINVPKRGIGDKTIEALQALAQDNGTGLYDAIEIALETGIFAKKTHSGLKDFFETLKPHVRRRLEARPAEVLDAIVAATGYVKELTLEDTIEAKSRIENIDELRSQLLNFESVNETPTLTQYLQEVSLLSDQDEIEEDESGHVLLMTIHAAKGLEFPYVYLVGMEEGLFPSQMTMDTDQGLEEERRLCYVGITRAEKVLHLTHARIRQKFGKTMEAPMSRFIKEMPQDLIESHSGTIGGYGPKSLDAVLQKHGGLGKQGGVGGGVGSAGVGGGYKVQQQSQPVTADMGASLKPGTRVRHKLFGDGMIITTTGTGEKLELTVAFDKKGIKKLMLGFAPLEII